MIDRILLGQWPTPVSAFPLAPGLWLKDEGACSPIYGGNKVRKLEFLLPGTSDHLVTIGAEGSHHVLATALFARSLGKRVTALLFPRPPSPHATRVQALNAELCACEFVTNGLEAFKRVETLVAEGASYLPPGGSNPLGAKGWELAGEELAAQVAAGLLPKPRRIVLPLGTAATAAGLATGLRRAGLDSEVIGVRVVPLSVTSPEAVAALGGPVTIDDRWLGEGYGHSTKAATAAIALAATQGLTLEPTYSGKALAAALDYAQAHPGSATLYWNTLSTVSMPSR